MNRKKWLARAGIFALALLAGDGATKAVLQTNRARRALTAGLERAFGRPVEAGRFDLRLLPSPRLVAQSVTVSEDPAFGYEYFLRAERVTAGLRWSGLLRGRFEFGTFSFTRPSLNLVRDSSGRWNLERWLPPVRQSVNAGKGASAGAGPQIVGPAPQDRPVRLDLVEFDEGRINFKNENEKLPVAFTGVSGKVEQITSGRWTLRLEAQPWRSGTPLQAAGTLFVQGDLAGTSSRLQPAEIRMHWGEASLADLMRLVRGQDFGLRGEATVDAVARSGARPAGIPKAAAEGVHPPSGEWTLHVEARAKQIHRWDLTERRDNPALNVLMDGRWNTETNEVRIAPLTIEGPRSNARGEAVLTLGGKPSFQLRIDSAGIQAADLLAWYRGFRENVAEGVAAEGFLAGAATLNGWPLALQNAAFSSPGGTLRAPGLAQPVRIGRIEGGRTSSRIALEPVWIVLGNARMPAASAGVKKTAGGRGAGRAAERPVNAVSVSAAHALESGAGSLSLEGRVDKIEDLLTLAAALGRPLERGWKGKGSAAGSLRWAWQGNPREAKLSGHLDFSRGELQVAGLNLPLTINAAQLEWADGAHRWRMDSVEGFGGEWSGECAENGTPAADGEQSWRFQLRGDHLNAAELDRWVGPRARPGWLERLLPSLLGSASSGTSASELIRRIRADGEIRVEELTIEKISLKNVKAAASLRDFRLLLRDATAEYAGGRVRGSAEAEFAPQPRYQVNAQIDKIRIAELIAPAKPPRGQGEPIDGVASGEMHLATQGVGREELLKTLEGRGRIQLQGVALQGWGGEPSASLDAGDRRFLASRWPAGKGEFAIRQSAVWFEPLWLESGIEKLRIRGTVSFSREADLELTASHGKRTGIEHTWKVEGPLEEPRVSVERRTE